MAIKTTRWTPDHCSCTIDYTWDDSVDPSVRVHTFSASQNACPDHSDLAGDPNHFAVVLAENQRKNTLYGKLLANFPILAQNIQNNDGSTTLTFKNGITLNFSFSGKQPNRILNISFSGITLSANQKTALQTLADNNFGAGKTVIS